MAETGEARKGAAVRSTSDAGGITGWRRRLGHYVREECPFKADATTASEFGKQWLSLDPAFRRLASEIISEELSYLRVAEHAVLEPKHVMPFVFEN